MQFGTIPPTLALVRDGRVRALAVTGEKRSAVLPDVPTIAESGVAGYESTLWQAVVVPAATPPAIIGRLNEEIVAALASPDVKATLEKQGIELEPSTPAQLAARIRSDLGKWGDVIRGAGIKTQ
jgi:tripartite-type tricarboxylate transporter receptor subunit TctC